MRARRFTILCGLWLLLACPGARGGEESAGGGRRLIPLDGEWLFQRDGGAEWKKITVPSSFESHEGTDWSGIGRYRKAVAPPVIPGGTRVLLHFQAAATAAVVRVNDVEVGSHLGGWTPFRFDITDIARKTPPGGPMEIAVRLDEKVGHNTQGFLPVIAPHFGGIWQEVRLLVVPETYIDDLTLHAYGDPETGRIELGIPLAGTPAPGLASLKVRWRLRGQERWSAVDVVPAGARAGNGGGAVRGRREGNVIRASIEVPGARLWSLEAPNLYELEIEIPGGDVARTRAAFRTIEVFGEELRLNGSPLSVRGILNWGYYAPLTAPNPGEETFRWDIEFARARGFNLMKFCLWVPPKRYLELADETGFLAWMEYPTWHPQLTKEHLEALCGEFMEFFLFDRNHPSVILRSLTCETGAGADLDVIRDLYDRAHSMIPGSVVEDDSSWIGWNRIHDFYDDHPYGNNHTWVPTLRGFKEYILAHGAKPLVLGEAIAADTWVDKEPLDTFAGGKRPFWVPGFFDDAQRWKEAMHALYGPGGLDRLLPDSMVYAQLMRKYQVEAYRREIPYGGYVLSVIRDFSTAAMGFVDYLGHPKWTETDWEWQRDTICLLATEADCRSFFAGDRLRADLLVSHFGLRPLENGELVVVLEDPGRKEAVLATAKAGVIRQNIGTLAKVVALDFPLPATDRPVRLIIRAVLTAGDAHFRNQWPVWVVPRPEPLGRDLVTLGASVPEDLAADLFPRASRFGDGEPGKVLVATRFDDWLVGKVEEGWRVLLLPDGGEKSFPLAAHWFLRGGPYVPAHSMSAVIPRDLFVELQHFDLAGDVIPEVGYLDAIDPILLLWDTHDLKKMKTHGLIFETAVAGKTASGDGRLLVSAVRHGSPSKESPANAAGRWLLRVLVEDLAAGPAPRRRIPEAMWRHLKERLHEEKVSLAEKVWRFKPEPPGADVVKEWSSPALALDAGWKDIHIGSAWESQGYPALDGWAWYRLSVKIPEGWKDRSVYLSFEGVDDMYELYAGGRLVARCGDIATKKDTFNERRSHDITAFVKPGEECVIAVRVYDWYGAGGIFRPVTLGTAGFAEGPEMLR